MNHLADHSDAELKVLRGKRYTKHGYNGGMPFLYDVEKEKSNLPETFDWRLYGAVTPVKGNLIIIIDYQLLNLFIFIHE